MLSNQGTLPKIDTETGIEYDTSKLPGRFLTYKKKHKMPMFVNSLPSHTNLYCLLDKDMISKMLERLEKLLNGVAVQRALSVHSIDHNEVVRLAELRVVRECNLPDSYTSFLDVSHA